MIELGGVADDFTGATDLATNWRARGRRVAVLLEAAHSPEDLEGLDAAVIALKSRTASVEEAVTDSLTALRVLRAGGAEQIYDKYCSTFDSTPRGNIGPVLDALAAELEVEHAVVVPSFPDAGRTVYQRHLFVHDELLSESPMRRHPLTPMTESDVTKLLRQQSERKVDWVLWQTVQEGADAVAAALAESSEPRHVVVDAISNADLRAIAQATAQDALVSGGSGLALGVDERPDAALAIPIARGHRAILAGSASSATRGQVAHARQHMPSRQLDLDALAADLPAEVERLAEWFVARWMDNAAGPALVYATSSLGDVVSEAGAAALIETAYARLSARLVELGMRQLLVAGGETSGSVLKGLGVQRLDLGEPVAPGLSWAVGDARAVEGESLNLLLKSGNFGNVDLFTQAWESLR